MNEKDDKYTEKETIDFPIFNSQKDYLNTKKKNNTDSESVYIIVIHFPNHKSYSFQVPQIWNNNKLISFIQSTFKPEFTKNSPIFIFHGNHLSPFSETPLKDFLETDKINHIIITLKNQIQDNLNENTQNTSNINNLSLKSNKEVFKSDEFCKMEKYAIDDYFKIFKNEAINNFPLMNPSYNNRREQIITNSTLDKLANFEPIPLEDFPFRNYFQLNIIIKCFISFFAFGIYIKGFNFILFLCVLVGYYWYCVNNVIDEFYKRRIQEIGISEEDYNRIKINGIEVGYLKKLNTRGLFVLDYEKDEENTKTNEEKKDNIKIDNNINININKEANEIKINNEENLKEDKKDNDEQKDKNDKFNPESNKMTVLNDLIYSKEEMKNLDNKNKEKEDEKNINENSPLSDNINDILTGNRLRGQNNNINRINNNNIFEQNNNNIMNNNNIFKNNNNIFKDNNNIFNENNNINNNNVEKKDNKIQKEEDKEKQEENRQEPPIQIIWQIIKVFILSFIPVWCDQFEVENPLPVNNNNVNNENNDEDENENENNNDNMHNNENINSNSNINNINNDFNNNENNLNQEDDSNNVKMTSSKVVNISEDSSRDNRIYNLIKRDNQSSNENEYVFSENGGIDNLSMNSELFKQKKEKEKEKEKEKDKEKEKQIFEEDEEYVIEEDKKKKE